MEGPQHQPGQGRPNASPKPALHKLDHDTLNRVLIEVEPEALALLGSHRQRALSVCLCTRLC